MRKHLAFWASRGKGIAPACEGKNASRFVFFGAYTADFISFEAPFVLFDPGCDILGLGGIDGNLVRDVARGLWVLSYKDHRGNGRSNVDGIRMLTASDLRGPWLGADVGALVVPPLVEAPELVLEVPIGASGPLLYYDCSFWPIPIPAAALWSRARE